MAAEDELGSVDLPLIAALRGDLTITYSGHSKTVHKAKLSQYSGWFRRALASRFKEGQASTINLEGDDPEVVSAMLQHLYGASVEGAKASCESKQNDRKLLFYAELFVLADKYEIPSLRDEIMILFPRTSNTMLQTLKESNFHSALNCIYNMPNGSYLEDFRNYFMSHFGERLKDLMYDESFKDVLEENARLASDILGRCTRHLTGVSGRMMKCSACYFKFVWSAAELTMPEFQAEKSAFGDPLHCPSCTSQSCCLPLAAYEGGFEIVGFILK